MGEETRTVGEANSPPNLPRATAQPNLSAGHRSGLCRKQDILAHGMPCVILKVLDTPTVGQAAKEAE